MTRRPRVAIDATVLSQRVKGAGRVAKRLIPALAAIDDALTYIALTTEDGAAKLDPGMAEFEVAIVPPMQGLQWEVFGLNRAARRSSADLILTLREYVGFGGPPTVMHVFEPPAYRLQLRGSLRRSKRASKDVFLHLSMRGSIHRAAAVTSGSESTADWFRHHYGINPKVILPGIDEEFLQDVQPIPSADKELYFLHLASGDSRENTDLVLEAFARLDHPSIALQMVGAPDNFRTIILERSQKLGITGRVHVEGWVSDSRLRDLYIRAQALIHPSSHEGFCGYPALEAMALGTPVVALASPGSEALVGRALVIDRADPALLANALLEVIDEASGLPSVADRARAWTRSLTWEATANQFVSLFHEVLKAAA